MKRLHSPDKRCNAAIWHGPGHQSITHCQVAGRHTIHEAIYGSFDRVAIWRGKKVFSGVFDEPPEPKVKHPAAPERKEK